MELIRSILALLGIAGYVSGAACCFWGDYEAAVAWLLLVIATDMIWEDESESTP